MATLLALPSCQCSFATGASRPQLRSRLAVSPAGRTSLCVQAKLTKAKDFRSLSKEEIVAEVDTAKRDLFQLRFDQKAKKDIKSSDFPKLKLKAAQLMVVLREKEIEDGETDRRAWRRKAKQANIAAGFPQF